MKRGYDRRERIADLIQEALAQLILQDTSDERFSLVTITSVTVSRDLSFAKVYVSILLDDENKIKQVIEALNGSTKFLRYNLAHAIKLRIVPELKFIYDESTARGFRISNLIDSVMKKSEKDK
jgi:ribosome-binding factor A